MVIFVTEFATKVVFVVKTALLLYSQPVARLPYFLDDVEYDAYFDMQQYQDTMPSSKVLSMFHDSKLPTNLLPITCKPSRRAEAQRNPSPLLSH